MKIIGSKVWAMKVKLNHEQGETWLFTGEHREMPSDMVLNPQECVDALQEKPSQPVWCKLLGLNVGEVRKLWNERDEELDNLSSEPNDPG